MTRRSVLLLILMYLMLLPTVVWAAFPVDAARNTGPGDSSATTDHTINNPSGLAAGDQLIVAHVCRGSTTHNTISGHTEMVDEVVSGAVDLTLMVSRKIADGGEGSTTAVTTSTSVICVGASWRITGQHAITAPEIVTNPETASNTTPDPPNLDPSGWGIEDTLWLVVGGIASTGGTGLTDWPDNYTNLADLGTPGTPGSRIMIGSRQFNASNDDPTTWTDSNSAPTIGATIAIRPAGANLRRMLLLGVE